MQHYLPLDSMVPVRERRLTGDAGALAVGGGGGGGGDVTSAPLPRLRETGSPSSSELKSESSSVSVIISNTPYKRSRQIGQDRVLHSCIHTPQSFAWKDVTQKQTHIPQTAIYLMVHEYILSIRVKLYKTIKNIHTPVTVKFCNTSC